MQNSCFAPEPKTPEEAKNGAIPVSLDPRELECHVRYHAAQDRAYQRASAELQKRKKARQLAEIGFASQKRAEAEESRKTEKHAVHIATANLRKQREEMKLGETLAQILGPDFNPGVADDRFLSSVASATGKAA